MLTKPHRARRSALTAAIAAVVLSAGLTGTGSASVTPTAAGSQPNPPTWGLDRIDQVGSWLDRTYNYPNTGDQSTVYIVDTGIAFGLPEFGGRAVLGIDTVGDGRNGADCNGHGTFLSAIVGGEQYGVAKDTTLVSVRVLNCVGSGSNAGILEGLDWIAANQAPNSTALISFAGPPSVSLATAVEALIASGVTVVVVAGNSNADACNFFPAHVRRAITAGASGADDQRVPGTNYGPCVDLYAPGLGITGPNHTGGVTTINGTAPAAAYVAGASALYLTHFDNAPPDEVHDALVSNATPPIGILYTMFIPPET